MRLFAIGASIHYVVRCLTAKNLLKSQSHDIGWYNDRIALKFDRPLESTAADVPVKFQSDWNSQNRNLAASGLHKILR